MSISKTRVPKLHQSTVPGEGSKAGPVSTACIRHVVGWRRGGRTSLAVADVLEDLWREILGCAAEGLCGV